MPDQMASHDPLTMLLNRRSMDPHLNLAMEYAKKTFTPFTIVMGDIDDFKKVNDTCGHEYGDKILVMISLKVFR